MTHETRFKPNINEKYKPLQNRGPIEKALNEYLFLILSYHKLFSLSSVKI